MLFDNIDTRISTPLDDFEFHLENIELLGFTVIHNVLTDAECDNLAALMDRLNQAQNEEFGVERLKQLKDYGVIRDMLVKEPAFFSLAMQPVALSFVERIVGETAILHLQNGIVLEPMTQHAQARFHRDFAKDFVNETVLALNTFFLIDDFTTESGGTWVVPFSHKSKVIPSAKYMEQHAVQIIAPRGSLFVFDGLLVHKAGDNYSSDFRRAINHQYTRPFIKQQIDYVEMLNGKIDANSRGAQLLGFWSRPPKTVKEYRVDPAERTYRPGQG